jgi:hypothetical protein
MGGKKKVNTKDKAAKPFPSSKKSGSVLRLNAWSWCWVAVCLYLIFSFFTFSLRVSEGGDDSTYIIRALMLLKEGQFPSYQGPLYPAVLSLFLLPFGFSLGLLKISSWIFLTASLVLFFKAFQNKVSNLALRGTILMLVVNHHFLYFASQTYSEAFFMMLQGLFVLLVLDLIKNKPHSFGWTNNVKLAFLIFLLVLTRTIGIAALPALLAYFLFRRQYKDGLSVTLVFSAFFLLFLILKFYIWELSPLAGGQVQSLLYKNPYHSSLGNETLLGFFGRFVGNANSYLSKHFMIMVGLKPALSLTQQPWVTALLFLLFFNGLIRFIRKNLFLLFIGIYLMFLLGATFFSLQTLWDQSRLIMPYFPFMVLFLFETFVSFTTHSEYKIFRKLPLFILALCFSLSLAQTLRQTDFSAIGKQLNGNRYYGYTPDWENYLKMAEYISRELPSESYVACRKPNIARIYGQGKPFHGIYRLPTEDPDSLLSLLKEAGVTHIMAAHLRKNPRYNSGQIINTIHRYISLIVQKYPNVFILRKAMGSSESAGLFEIDYEALDSASVKENPPHE